MPPFHDDQVGAARLLLKEVCELLAEHRDDAVLIGGWVPGLLYPTASPPHPGSIDVDVALRLKREAYAKVVSLLHSRGFHQRENGYEFVKEVDFGDGRKAVAKLDLLTSVRHHEEHFPNAAFRAAPHPLHGTEISFRNNAVLEIGAGEELQVRVAGIVAILVMKGLAVHDRDEPKDAYDILFCLENFPEDFPALAAEFAPYADDALVQESLRKLGARFRSEDDDGPRRVADFEGVLGEAREIRKRDAFTRVNDFLAIVGQGNGAFLR